MNLVMKMEARNIAQRYAILLFVLKLGDSATITNGKLQQALEIMQCQEHKPFAGTNFFLKAEPLLKMSSAADDHQKRSR